MELGTAAPTTGTNLGFQFDSEGTQYTLPIRNSKRQQKFPNVQKAVTNFLFREVETSDQLEVFASGLNEFIAFELSLVSEVEYVYTALRNNVFYVWVVINQFEREVRERIYEREKAVIDEFSMFEFDFYIISRMERNVQELISESIDLTYERAPET